MSVFGNEGPAAVQQAVDRLDAEVIASRDEHAELAAEHDAAARAPLPSPGSAARCDLRP